MTAKKEGGWVLSRIIKRFDLVEKIVETRWQYKSEYMCWFRKMCEVYMLHRAQPETDEHGKHLDLVRWLVCFPSPVIYDLHEAFCMSTCVCTMYYVHIFK